MNGTRGPLLAAALVLTGAMHLVAQAAVGWPVLDGNLSGPDGYMRLHRVALLMGEGNWHSGLITRSNTPFGEILHWTRPFDLIVLLGAAPLALFLPLPQALLAWSMVLGPLLHAATALLLAWAARPLLGPRHAIAVIFLFASQIFVAQQFSPGRPDHHGFLLLLFTLHLGLLLRLLAGDDRDRTALAAGCVAALALWASPEMQVAAAAGHAALALAWWRRGPPAARPALLHALAGAAAITLALLIERAPTDWLTVEYDRLSIVHVAASATAAALWLALARVRKHRGPALLAGGAGAAALLLIAFPGLVSGPYGGLDPRVASLYLARVGEVQPVLDPDRIALYFGLALIAVAWLACRLRTAPAGPRSGPRLYLLGASLLFLALGLWQARWAGYTGVLAVPAACDLLRALWLRLANPGAKLAAALLLALSPILAAGVAMRLHAPGPPAVACDYHAAARHLATIEGPHRVMTSLFYGSAILFHSPHAVVGTAYHRNRDGILDSIDFFHAPTADAARAIARRRGLTLVLYCPGASEAGDFRFPGPRPPDWLQPLALPASLGEWRLFRIVGEGRS